MRLSELEFTEFRGHPREWILDPVTFRKINLIVGLNASGKSRLLNVINSLAIMLRGERREPYISGSYRATFRTGKDTGTATYELEYENKTVFQERYQIGNTVFLDRQRNGEGTIRAAQLNEQTLNFEAPATQLAAVLKRDRVQHPFLENLHEWAVSVKHYRFGTTMGAEQVALVLSTTGPESTQEIRVTDPQTLDPNRLFLIYQDGFNRFGDEFKQSIIKDLQLLDYRITDIGLDYLDRSEVQGTPIPPQVIFVQERDLACKTRQLEMSAGMFRALNIAIQLNYWAATKSQVCILVDDIGEGLDFERSTKLISLLIRKARDHEFQIIMTTNDRFVMNSVPLEYWGVLIRNKNKVHFVNQDNSPKIFEDFRKIGLNNFDFFSRRMYRSKRK